MASCARPLCKDRFEDVADYFMEPGAADSTEVDHGHEIHGDGWDMTFEDFKRLADREYALGVNSMCQHYFGATPYSPWWDDLKLLNDHMARLSLALSKGEQLNDGKAVFRDSGRGELHHHRRSFRDGELIFLANSSLEENASGAVMLPGKALLAMDTFTGEITRRPAEMPGKGMVRISYDIPPAGHLLYFVARSRARTGKWPAAVERVAKALQPVKPLGDIEVERRNNNYLPLVALDTFSTDNIKVRYKFYTKSCLCSAHPLFICEKPDLWEVSLNGKTIKPIKGLHQLDSRDGCYDTMDLVHDGENIIELHGSTISLSDGIPFAFIAGDFNVIPDSKTGWRLVPAETPGLGSWSSQGMPFYSWDVAYRRQFEVPEEVGERVLRLGKWKGTVCEVWVNGTYAGLIFLKPYELNIGKFLQPGENQVEVICVGSRPGADYGLYEEFTIDS